MANGPQSINRARWQAQVRDLTGFDFKAPAELYPSRSRRVRGPFSYKRFNTAAEAVRLPSRRCPGRHCSARPSRSTRRATPRAEMRALYETPAFPLKRARKRKAPPDSHARHALVFAGA